MNLKKNTFAKYYRIRRCNNMPSSITCQAYIDNYFFAKMF